MAAWDSRLVARAQLRPKAFAARAGIVTKGQTARVTFVAAEPKRRVSLVAGSCRAFEAPTIVGKVVQQWDTLSFAKRNGPSV